MKDYGEKEVRSFGENAIPVLTEERKVEGYAIVFNKRSAVMYDLWEGRYFEEIIRPEAISDDLLNRCDIKALAEHNRERLLARRKNGQGTLSLEIDETGLRYSFEAPKTRDGDDVIELIKRGDIAGSSFAFRAVSKGAVEKTWQADRKCWLYEVKRFDGIFDVSVTSDPAYSSTTANVRSLADPTIPEPEVPAPEPEPKPEDIDRSLAELKNTISKI